MKRLALLLAAFLLSLSGMAQKQARYTENDVKQFYRTLQGDYDIAINDSTQVRLHITPIWENDAFRWLYVEATRGKDVLLQKVFEVQPKSDKVIKVAIYNLKQPERFEGKWANRNYFDGFTKNILGSRTKVSFFKTADYTYQTHWVRVKPLDCFPNGDLLHFKFVQAEERCYVKRMPANETKIIGYHGEKQPTD